MTWQEPWCVDFGYAGGGYIVYHAAMVEPFIHTEGSREAQSHLSK